MTAAIPLILAVVIAIISFPAYAQEVAYAYGDSGGRPLESGNITEYNGSDIVTSSIASSGPGSRSFPPKSSKNVEEIKKEINLKLNIPNPTVEDKGSKLVLDYPGDRTIGQICSIYNYMVGNWSYKADTRGIEVFQYSNKSLENGEGRYSGQGDCDDFSILMASLIESIGGTSRIVLAYGPNGGHAYTEVYLGKAGSSESDVLRMIAWLRKNYRVKEINTHTDLKTDDVWLNLDWWREPGGAKHPGGPFFKATSQVPIPIRENTSFVPLMPLNEPPVAQFAISPFLPIVGENASFNASKSKDIGGKIDSYLWDFGDGNKTDKISEPTANHIYQKGGPYTVTLTVEDDEGATNISSQNIMINNPPQANLTITPQKPVVGDLVKLDASQSNDAEDGKNLAYHWEINNNSAMFSVVSPPKQMYDEMGMYWVNLTVSDKNDAKSYKNLLLKINHPPIPRIAFDSANLSLGKMINFSAGASEDLDGEIVSYAWDFGDNSSIDYNVTALHSYEMGGDKTVNLTLTDNDGAVFSLSKCIYVNLPPKAKFSVDPREPKKGDPVIFDASASSDPDGKIQRYLWDFGLGRVEPEVYYSEFAEYTYNRPKEYNVTLTVEDDKGATGSSSRLVEVAGINNNKPNVVSLLPDKLSPQGAGASIVWTAYASDSEKDQLFFRFFLDRIAMTEWSNNSSWAWNTSNSSAGNHAIEIQVKDGKHSEDGDDVKVVDFELKSPIEIRTQEVISGQFEVTDSILDLGNVDLSLIKDPIFMQNGVAIWQIMPDSNYPYVDQFKFYAKIDNNKISLLLAGENKSKSLRGMLPSLYKLQGQDATLSSRPDSIHYCYPYDNNKTLIYSLLKDAFSEIKSNSAIGSNAQLDGNPKYKSSFTDNVSIFGYYITSTAFNSDNFSYHNWPWGTGTDECKYGSGSHICDYSTGTVQAVFDFDIVDPRNYYIFGFINNDNREETQYRYNDNLWLNQVDYGPGSTLGEKFADRDFPSRIELHGQKTWSSNRLMTWMAIDADLVNARGHITGNGSNHVNRDEYPDVLQSIEIEKGLIEWPLTDQNIIFKDDFSIDKGWISDPAEDTYFIARDPVNNDVQYHTHRGSIQKMYHSVDQLGSDFELGVDAVLSNVNMNGFIWMGLTGDVNDLDWYWKGLGFNINHYDNSNFAQVVIKYNDGSMYSSVGEGKIIDVQLEKWYTYKLSRTDDIWKLQQYDGISKALLGTIEGQITKSLPTFNYILFGNGDTTQWENADGRIDNLLLSSPQIWAASISSRRMHDMI